MNALVPLLITLLIQSFSALGMLAVPVLVPVEAGLNGTGRLSPTGIGIYLVCAYLGAVLGSLSCGPFVERWGAIRTSQVALLLTASGLGLAALFPELIFVAALLVGLGYGPITPASSHVLIQTTPARQRNLVFSVKQTGVPVGVGLSGFCIPPLSTSGGWVGTLLWLGLACALVAASAQWIQAELDARTSPFSRSTGSKSGLARFAGFPAWIRHMSAPVSVITHYRSLRSLAAVSFVLSGIQISFTSYLVSFLTSGLLMPTLFAGAVLGLSQLGGIVGRILFGFLSDGYVNPLVMLMAVALTIALAAFVTAMLAAGASTAETFALTGSMSDIWLALLMFVFGASASGWNGIYLAEVARRAPPGMAGTATSGALACTFIGVLLGAPVFGFIVSTSGGFGAAFAMQSVLAIGVAGLLFRFRKSMADGVVRSIS